MKTGELQSFPFLQLITPDPYSPPIRNAAFFSDGMTTTHSALLQRSCGMPLSGVVLNSLRTLADSLKRLTSSLDSFAVAVRVVIMPNTQLSVTIAFMRNSSGASG